MPGVKILLYHSVGRIDPGDSLGIRVDTDVFSEQMEFLKASGFRVCSLKEAVAKIEAGRPLQQDEIAITFDDGWRSVYDNAFPVLRDEFGLRANVAVYSDVIGAPSFLNESMLGELHNAGWSMVSHTVTHDSLTTLSPTELDFELRASQQWLVDRGYNGSNVFIAPYHDYTDSERAATASYYTAARGYSATATVPDTLVLWMPDNPYQLTRGSRLKTCPLRLRRAVSASVTSFSVP